MMKREKKLVLGYRVRHIDGEYVYSVFIVDHYSGDPYPRTCLRFSSLKTPLISYEEAKKLIDSTSKSLKRELYLVKVVSKRYKIVSVSGS